MNYRSLGARAAAGVLAFFCVPTMAQQHFDIEVRLGAAVPSERYGEFDLDTGFTIEGTASYGLTPVTSFYGGWGWRSFDISDSDQIVVQSGYSIGLQYDFHLPRKPFHILFRAAVTSEEIKLRNDLGNLVSDTQHGRGHEFGAVFPLNWNEYWVVTPGLKYRLQNRSLGDKSGVKNSKLSYFAIDVGIRRKF